MDDGLEEIQSILSETSGGRVAEEVPTNHIGSGQGLAKEESNEQGNNGGASSGGGGASIIKNLIANILHPHNNGGEDHQQEGGGDKSIREDNLPFFSKTIGDTVPDAEEASLLIHAIVHD